MRGGGSEGERAVSETRGSEGERGRGVVSETRGGE